MDYRRLARLHAALDNEVRLRVIELISVHNEVCACELLQSNEQHCYGNPFPTCGDCLYARGVVRCP